MKQLFTLALLLCLGSCLYAQHPGFSKLYRYSGDTSSHAESITALTLDTTLQQLFFCSSGNSITDGTSYSVFYKTDMQGNVQLEAVDSIANGNVRYSCVAESEDGQYFYWAGNSYVHNDTSSLSWKIRKTDKDLNVVWDRLYPASALSNTVSNIKHLDSGYLMLLCFDYTASNNLGKPVKSSTIFMRKIDSAGNIVADYHPVDWTETDAYGLERTSDGGFMINGSRDEKGYVIKTDENGTLLSQQSFGTTDSRIKFFGMDKQPGSDSFFHAGQLINAYGSNALASAADEWGQEKWQQIPPFPFRYYKDTFFSVTHDMTSHVVFAGTSFGIFNVDVYERIGTASLVKQDRSSGTVLWSKIYRANYYQWYNNALYKVVALPDGGFMAGGSSGIPGELGNNLQQKSWLLRVDSNGCYNTECTDALAVREVKVTQENIRLFPNPSSNMVQLVKTDPFPAGTVVTLTDVAGKLLRTLESPAGKTQQVYQLRGTLLPGTYFIRVTMGERVVDKKLVLMF